MRYSANPYLRSILFVFIFLSSVFSFAVNNRTTFQSKIIKPDGLPLEAVNVNFKFTILDPSASCVLYSEEYSAVNMQGSGGLTSFSLGAGNRTYPVSGGTTLENVLDNSVVSFACQTPGLYTPTSADNRKIVMQFNDGNGWQTLPAMAINSVPYAMYAGKSDNAIKFNGKSDTAFVEYSTLTSLNCNSTTHAITFNGVSFSCIPVTSSSVTSASIIAALGYAPENSSTVAASFTTITNSMNTVGTSVTTLSSTVNSLSTSYTNLASAVSGITSSQWTTSGSAIHYSAGYVGIGTTAPASKLHIGGAPTATPNYGTLSLGSGAFNGSTAGFFTGPASGTSLAVNEVSGFAGNFLDLQANGVTKFRIAGNGDLNLGTTAYATRSVWLTTGNQAKLELNAGGVGQEHQAARLMMGGHNGFGANFHVYYGSSADTLNGDFRIHDYHGSTTATERFRINNVGNVGIGTTTPVTKLDVSGAIRISMDSTSCATGYTGVIRYNAGVVQFCDGSTWISMGGAGSVTSAAVISALGYVPENSSVVAASFTTITNSMNTVGTSITTLSSTVNNLSTSYTNLASTVSGITSSQWTTNGSNIGYIIGNVGIGTSAPAYRLDVAGDVNVTGDLKVNALTIGRGGGSISGNTALGENALLSNTFGEGNVANGSDALRSNTTGDYNTANGRSGLRMNTTGYQNVATGFQALYSNTTGRQNTANGVSALQSNTTGMGNIGVGYNAGSAITTGNYNVVIGSNTGSSIATVSNTVLIADGQGNERIRVDSAGNVGIGVTTPVIKLDVSGAIRISMDSATCAAGYAGAIRYNAGTVEMCNGTTWSAFGVAGAGIANFNGSTSGTQSFANGATGTAPLFVTANGVHTLNIPLASAGSVTAGLISNSDYLNFSNKITSSAASIAQVLGYVPAASGTLLSGVKVARVATSANIVLSGLQTIDTISLVAGDRVLVKNQSSQGNNGLYIVAAGAWTRAPELDTWEEVLGAEVYVVDGLSNQGMAYMTNTSILGGTLNATSIQWTTRGANWFNGNIGFGLSALAKNVSGFDNAVFGNYSQSVVTTGSENTGVGNYTLEDLTTGNKNTAVGTSAMAGVSSGSLNTALGYRSLSSLSTGDGNIGIGANAGWLITTGSNNVVIGSNTGAAIATSSNNILLADGQGNERMRITSSGAVGIGTTTPNAKLSVKESSTAEAVGLDLANINGSGSDQTSVAINLHHFGDSNPAVKIVAQESGAATYLGNLQFHTRGTNSDISPTERMRIDAAGNVGIGTTAPSYNLDVSGTLRVTGTAYTNGGYTTWTAASDQRLKDIHGSYDRGLADILGIDIVRFQYKANNTMGLDSSKEFVGVTAQNLQTAIPEAVNEETSGHLKGYLTINTTPVLWTLVNAVKELYHKFVGVDREVASIKAENVQLKLENAAQAKELDDVKARLEKIEKALNAK